MTEVMINGTAMEDMHPSDFERCCKLKDRLPSIVVEPTEGEVESGELRWPPEEFLTAHPLPAPLKVLPYSASQQVPGTSHTDVCVMLDSTGQDNARPP
ncbi:hypothetical protein JZ751_011412, partial [Albula glossodonta]